MDNYIRAAKLDRVIDGDTVSLHVDLGYNVTITERFRLHGIDAPEPHTETRVAGDAATYHLTVLLSAVELFVKSMPDKKGKYGRWICEIYAGGVNVNEQMVRDGHAVEAEY